MRATVTACALAVLLSACGEWDHVASDDSAPVAGASTELAAVQKFAGASASQPPVPGATELEPSGGAKSGAAVIPAGGGSNANTGGGSAAPATPPAAAPSVAPAAATPAPAPAPATVNSLDTIVDDMRLLNDMKLKGVNQNYGFAKGPGIVVMGNDPRGTNLPSWYTNSFPHLANGNYWNYVLPWFVLFEGEGNAATNTRVQMRDMRMYVLSRSTNRWTEIVAGNDVWGEFCPAGSNYHGCTGGDNKRAESSGGVSLKLIPNNVFHGWFAGRLRIDGPDVKAVYVTLQGRLIPDGVDDRAQAKYLFDVGADYYPTDANSAPYLPGVGVSRAKLITNEWRSFNFMTFSDVGLQDPGGGISEAEFRANPPPLQ